MVTCGGLRQRWKVVIVFTDHNESLNDRYRWVEETTVVLPVVTASNMVACGGREERRKLPLWREREKERKRVVERELGVVMVVIVAVVLERREERVATLAVVAVVVPLAMVSA